MMTVEESGERVSKMWQALAEQIANALPDLVIGGDVDKALIWGVCADACFFQATGEAPGRSVNEIVTPPKRTLND